MIEESFAAFPDRIAYEQMGRKITYREVDELSRAFGAWLQADAALQHGGRVALMLPNTLQYPIAMFGVLRAGGTVVNTNPLYTARELEHQLVDSGAETIVILENFAHVLQEVIERTQIRHVVITSIGELLGFPKGAIVNYVARRRGKGVPPFQLSGAIRFKDAVQKGRRMALTPVALGHQDVAFLQYTGGTTGVSKGAMLSHRNMVANVLQADAWMLDTFSNAPRATTMTVLPLYHIFALTANCLLFLRLGWHNILISNPRDLPGLVREMKKNPITYLAGVNTLFNGLLNTPNFQDIDFSSLRCTLGGGMAVQAAVAERWKQVTGNVLTQAWGLTETSPAACINIPGEDFNGSIGLPIASTEISIVDDAGNPLPIGQIGEICVRGPQVMLGYYNRPDETAKVMLPDGWLRTGDVGHMDERGYVYIEDRKKDMIIVSGFNVYPNEVESIVAAHPGVLEVAAVGQPDQKSGEAVALFVVRKDPNLTEQQLIEYCRSQLTGYKIPKHVYFRKELPKTNVGKILRRALRDEISA
ncbi:MAG: AMP-binding protein [Sinobacteraceae bacterium]|nr:AMP-binding protein [Gammaproteobacteria bacterium]MCP5470651.1 AMP-binding protein [Nevskiaceae bacterium]